MSHPVAKIPSVTPSSVDLLCSLTGLRFVSPEWFYLIVAISFGSAFLWLTPPLQVPDENAHFLRSLQISEGRIVSLKYGNATGDYLPPTLLEFAEIFRSMRFNPNAKTSPAQIISSGELQLDNQDRVFIGFSNAAIHPPLPYLPQSLGILIARQFSRSLLVLFYAGRCLNLTAAIILMFLAIRWTPLGKWVFAVLALTPMTVFLSASLSPDAVTNGLSFLLVAYVLKCASGQDLSLTRSHVLRLTLLSCAVGLSKQAYFLLPMCYLLIPASKLRTPKRYWSGFIVVTGAAFLSIFAWGTILRGIYSPADTMVGMDPYFQFHFIVAHPETFGRAVFRAICQAPMYVQQYIGVLGWLDTRLPRWVVIADLLAIAVVGLADTSLHLKLWQCRNAVSVATLVSATVMLIIYVTWEPVGSDVIHLQGRYFIPVGPLVVLALSGLSVAVSPLRLRAAAAGHAVTVVLVPCLLTATAYVAYERYYVELTTPVSAQRELRVPGESLEPSAPQSHLSGTQCHLFLVPQSTAERRDVPIV